MAAIPRNLRVLNETLGYLNEDSGRRYWIEPCNTIKGKRYRLMTKIKERELVVKDARFAELKAWIWGGLLILERYKIDQGSP